MMLDNKTIDLMIMFLKQTMKDERDGEKWEKMNDEIIRLTQMKYENNQKNK